MKKQLALLTFLFIFQFGFGQEDINEFWYDAINKQLREAVTDSSRVEAWAELANYYKFGRPDSGVYYGAKALKLARSISYVRGELKALQNLGFSYKSLRNESTYLKVGLESLRISRQTNNKVYEGYAMIGLGEIYYNSMDFEQSLDYFRKAFFLFKTIDQPEYEAISGVWVGKTYLALGQQDSALFYCYQAENLAKSVNLFWAEAIVGFQFASVYKDLNNADSALFYLRTHIDQLHNMGAFYTSQVNLEMARYYLIKEKKDSSIFYAREAMDVALKNKLYYEVTNASSFLSKLLEPKEALQFAELALAYTDSLNKLKDKTGFSDVTDFDEQMRQYELETAKSEFQNRLRMNIFLGSTFTLLVIAFFLYRNNRQKQRSKRKIEVAYERLKNTQSQLIQSEKMASLGELTAGIAHEIQNPLNFVNNFSEVNDELIEELREAVANNDQKEIQAILNDLKENESKIKHHGQRAEGIVKGMLQHSRTSHGEKEPTDLNALADEYLRLAYHGLRAKDKSFNADFKTEFDENLPKVQVVPQDIGRVLLNLINNAFYAVSSKVKAESIDYQPLVIVSTKKLEKYIQISVQDNGPGIPDEIKEKIFQPFFTTKPTGSGTGLGLSLSYDIVTQGHDGHLEVETKEGVGTRFIIKLLVS